MTKVLWKEGLFLTPQHFQTWDDYHERQSFFYASAGNPFNWGFRILEIDSESIGNWRFRINSLQATLRDGSTIDSLSDDKLPPERSFEGILAPATDSLKVYLALPHRDPQMPAVELELEQSLKRARFQRVVKNVTDYVTGSREREIECVAKKPEIRFETEPMDQFDVLPVAEIKLQASGAPILSTAFIPPVLALEASMNLQSQLSHLFGRVRQLANGLRSELPFTSGRALQLNLANLVRFLQYREVALATTVLERYHTHRSLHPAGYFQTLAGLDSGLSALFGDLGLEPAPVYDHDNLTGGFSALNSRLDTLLEAILGRGDNEIALTPDGDYWRADLSACSITATTETYIYAESSMDGAEFTKRFLSACTVAAPDRIDDLITFGTKGARLTHVMHPPPMLPPPGAGHYFQIDAADMNWIQVVQSKSCVIHGSRAQMPELQVQLFLVQP